MKITKKMISNILFVILIGLLLYPKSRTWLIRQVTFAPSINKVDSKNHLNTYNWKLKGLDTSDFDFEKARGKVVFVNFWATWCPPCRAELPLIQKLYNDYKDKMIFVFVTPESKEKVIPFLKENGYDLPSYNMYNREPSILTTRSIPASFLIDKKGNIIISKTGAADWNSSKVRKEIDKLL